MKKTKILWVLPLLALSGCQNATTSIEEIKFVEKFDSLKDNLKMTGVLSYKFYDAETNLPTEGKPVTTNLEVEFTETGYVLSYNGDFDENFTETLFKSEDNTVELRYINKNNELVVERPKDSTGKEYDFSSYTNPFVSLTNDMLDVNEDGTKGSFDLVNHLEDATEFVSRLTYYTFPELEEVSLLAGADGLDSVHIQTKILNEEIRTGVYTFDLTVAATGDDVVGPVTPEPVKDDEKQRILKDALTKLNNSAFEMTFKFTGGADVYDQKFFVEENGMFCLDNTKSAYSLGLFKDGEDFYEVFFDSKTQAYKKIKSRGTDDDLKVDWLTFAAELFVPSADGKEFVLDESVQGRSVGTFAMALTFANCYDVAATTNLTINLDDNNDVKTLTFTNSDGQKGVFTLTKIGSCEMPFNFSELPE